MTDCSETELGARRPVIIASNRGPVTFYRADNGEVKFRRGAGGLVTALSGLVGQIDAAWLSCANTAEDRSWSSGRIALVEGGESIYVQYLSPDEETYDRYYNHIANPLLWFLQHSMWNVANAPIIDKETWQAWEQGYVSVNRMFAQAIRKLLPQMPPNPLVMLQDYHLYLAANFLRSALPPKKRPTILQFVHIPWPGPEYWGILPPGMRQAILKGLCAVDLLGFQTNSDALNFIRTCQNFLPRAYVNYKHGRIWYRNHATYVRDFPIGIDVHSLYKLADSAQIQEYREEIREMVGDRQLVLRVDRIEPSKNIVRGFKAFEEFLEIFPQYRERVTFLALLVPSRLDVIEYQSYLDSLMAAAGQVNARYGTPEWEPIRVLVGQNYPRAVAGLTLYDALIVNAIADGMNLVAKEGPIVNRQDGVLILSERAGAHQQLASGSLVISPCDIYATAQAIHQALELPPEERRNKSERLRWLIEREDIDAWLCSQLDMVTELGL